MATYKAMPENHYAPNVLKLPLTVKGRVVMMPGQWHGKFPKVKATTEQIAACNPQTGIIEDWKK